MKKILITGATGFIGTNLIPQLIKNHKIVGISKNKIKFCKYNIKKNYKSSTKEIINTELLLSKKSTL